MEFAAIGRLSRRWRLGNGEREKWNKFVHVICLRS
jgi:hypothetical protein